MQTVSKIIPLNKSILWLVDFIVGSSFVFRLVSFVLILIIHLVLVIQHQDFNYLASFGGFVTIISFVFIFGYSLPREEPFAVEPYKPKITRKGDHCSVLLEEHSLGEVLPSEVVDKIEAAYKQKLEHHHSYLKIKRSHLSHSFYFTVGGTIIWAYASYLTGVCYP